MRETTIDNAMNSKQIEQTKTNNITNRGLQASLILWNLLVVLAIQIKIL